MSDRPGHGDMCNARSAPPQSTGSVWTGHGGEVIVNPASFVDFGGAPSHGMPAPSA